MMKKVITIIIIFTIIACSYSTVIINATTLGEQKQEAQQKTEEAEQQLEYVQEELTNEIVKIQQLDDEIRKAEEDISTLEAELADLQEKIDEITLKLDTVEKQYIENEELLQQRLIVNYEAGDITYLDILMNSSNIVDFISNYYVIEELIKYDLELLEQIEKERQEVESSKIELDEKKATLKTKKAKKEQLSVITQNNKIVKEQNVEKLSIEEQELQQKINEYKEEEARIEALIKIATNEYEYTGDYKGGVMAWPVAKSGTYITSGYGIREHPIQGIIKSHSGIDIGNAGFGAPVIAAADGIVTMAGRYGGYGNCVMINHGNGISTLYGHGQAILTEVGKEVKKGDLIMEVGSTGISTGPHLHFEVRINGSCTDPMPFLQGSTE